MTPSVFAFHVLIGIAALVILYIIVRRFRASLLREVQAAINSLGSKLEVRAKDLQSQIDYIKAHAASENVRVREELLDLSEQVSTIELNQSSFATATKRDIADLQHRVCALDLSMGSEKVCQEVDATWLEVQLEKLTKDIAEVRAAQKKINKPKRKKAAVKKMVK